MGIEEKTKGLEINGIQSFRKDGKMLNNSLSNSPKINCYRCNKCKKTFKTKDAQRYHAKKVCADAIFEKISDQTERKHQGEFLMRNSGFPHRNSTDTNVLGRLTNRSLNLGGLKLEVLNKRQQPQHDDAEEKYSVKRTKYTDGTILYSCPKCDSQFKSTEDIYFHMSKRHSNPIGRVFKTSSVLDNFYAKRPLITKFQPFQDSVKRINPKSSIQINVDNHSKESEYDWSEIDKDIYGSKTNPGLVITKV